MQSSTLRLVKRLGICALGVALIVAGLIATESEFTTPQLASMKYVCGNAAVVLVIIAWGVMFCLAARFPYALGIRLSVGAICFSISAILAGYFADCLLLLDESSPPLLALAILTFLSGCHCFSVKKHVSRAATYATITPPNK